MMRRRSDLRRLHRKAWRAERRLVEAAIDHSKALTLVRVSDSLQTLSYVEGRKWGRADRWLQKVFIEGEQGDRRKVAALRVKADELWARYNEQLAQAVGANQ